MSSPPSTSLVTESIQDNMDNKLAELRANIINMVNTAIDSFTKEGLIGSAKGKSPNLEPTPSGSPSSSSASHTPLPSHITSTPAPDSPAPTSKPTPAATTPISSPPNPTSSKSKGNALASYIASASPFTPDLDNHLKAVQHQVQGIPVGNRITFPQSSNIGLSKDKKATIAQMVDSFKLFHTILQISTCLALRHPDAMEEIKDIPTTTLIGMWTQLHAHNEQWMTCALPAEALPAFHAMEGSTLMVQDHEQFFSALKFTTLKQQASKPQPKSSSKWNSSSQLSPSLSSPSSRVKKPYNNHNNNKTSPSGHGTGSSTTQD